MAGLKRSAAWDSGEYVDAFVGARPFDDLTVGQGLGELFRRGDVLAQCVSYRKVGYIMTELLPSRFGLTEVVQPLTMMDKWVEVAPKDVIWDNIDVSNESSLLIVYHNRGPARMGHMRLDSDM